MKIPRRRTARAFIYDTEQKLFLIAKGSLLPFDWHLPGGGINRAENSEQALKRELKEELDICQEHIIKIIPLHKINMWSYCIPHEAMIYLVYVKNLKPKLSWEISSVKWILPEHVSKYISKKFFGRVVETIDNIR